MIIAIVTLKICDELSVINLLSWVKLMILQEQK